MESEPLVLEANLTKRDLNQFGRSVIFRSGRTKWILALFVLVGAILIAFGGFFAGIVAFVVAIVLALLFSFPGRRVERANPLLTQESEIAFDDVGVDIKRPSMHTHIHWEALEEL